MQNLQHNKMASDKQKVPQTYLQLSDDLKPEPLHRPHPLYQGRFL